MNHQPGSTRARVLSRPRGQGVGGCVLVRSTRRRPLGLNVELRSLLHEWLGESLPFFIGLAPTVLNATFRICRIV